MELFIQLLDYFGTIVFALAGVLVASNRKLDLFGVMIVGIVTAVGGGTLRDLILNKDVFWLTSNQYIWLAIITSIITFILARKIKFPLLTIQIADALGLAVFTVIGCRIAIELNHTPLICVVTGVMTGVFGGIIRDTLTATKPMIFEKEIYATAVMLGAIVYVNLEYFLPYETFNTLFAMWIVFSLRVTAIFYRLRLPLFLTVK